MSRSAALFTGLLMVSLGSAGVGWSLGSIDEANAVFDAYRATIDSLETAATHAAHEAQAAREAYEQVKQDTVEIVKWRVFRDTVEIPAPEDTAARAALLPVVLAHADSLERACTRIIDGCEKALAAEGSARAVAEQQVVTLSDYNDELNAKVDAVNRSRFWRELGIGAGALGFGYLLGQVLP